MLQNLHVKNLALIDEIEVEFQEGLNILTGETRREINYPGICEPCSWRKVSKGYDPRGSRVWLCGIDIFHRER